MSPFPDRVRKFQGADGGEFSRDPANHSDGVVAAAIEYDDELEIPMVMLLEIPAIVPQHRLYPALFVVSWNEEQQARLGHSQALARRAKKAISAAPCRGWNINSGW